MRVEGALVVLVHAEGLPAKKEIHALVEGGNENGLWENICPEDGVWHHSFTAKQEVDDFRGRLDKSVCEGVVEACHLISAMLTFDFCNLQFEDR